jgi:hypothetical protein
MAEEDQLQNVQQPSSFDNFLFELLGILVTYIIPGVCGASIGFLFLAVFKQQPNNIRVVDIVFLIACALVVVFRDELYEWIKWR